jgi:hypothetical protein
MIRGTLFGAVAFTLILSGCAPAMNRQPPLVLEPGRYSYTFAVPKGWEFSFEEAETAGVRLVFFPQGGGFHQSSTIVYVNEVRRSDCAGTVNAAMERTIALAQRDSPDLRVVAMPPLKDGAGHDVPVRVLTGARDPRQAKEALAFIPHDDTTVLVVLTTKDPASWDADYAAFSEIVDGHHYFTCNSPDLAVPCR